VIGASWKRGQVQLANVSLQVHGLPVNFLPWCSGFQTAMYGSERRPKTISR
jgi:hypothetical protein